MAATSPVREASLLNAVTMVAVVAMACSYVADRSYMSSRIRFVESQLASQIETERQARQGLQLLVDRLQRGLESATRVQDSDRRAVQDLERRIKALASWSSNNNRLRTERRTHETETPCLPDHNGGMVHHGGTERPGRGSLHATYLPT